MLTAITMGFEMGETKPLSFHTGRLEAVLRDLWRSQSIDLHMCDGTRRNDQFGLLQDLREDIRVVLSELRLRDERNWQVAGQSSTYRD